MHPKTWGPAEWTAFAALGTFAVALIASGITLVQVVQAKRLYRDQVRPFVIVDYALDHPLISISAKNIGSTPAKDVSIAFDPPLHGSQGFDPANAPMFAKGVPMMAPGREMRVMLGGSHLLFAEAKKRTIPTAYEVTVTYSNLQGHRFNDPPLYLDLSAYNETEIERQPIVEALKAIELELRQKRLASSRPEGFNPFMRKAAGGLSPTTDAPTDPEGAPQPG